MHRSDLGSGYNPAEYEHNFFLTRPAACPAHINTRPLASLCARFRYEHSLLSRVFSWMESTNVCCKDDDEDLILMS